MNPFKNQAPFSANYKKILEQRKGLPVYQKMTEFLEVFSKNQITVMEGQTGSGKTTQIPQFVCYSDLPMLRGKMVACTQPRRVAAMSVAKRVADEMDGEFWSIGPLVLDLVGGLAFPSTRGLGMGDVLLIQYSPTRKTGRILYSIRRYDGTRYNVP